MKILKLMAVIILFSSAYGHADDLRRGVAIVKEMTYLKDSPSPQSKNTGALINQGEKVYVVGLSLDGVWAKVLKMNNSNGWVNLFKLNRLPNSDPQTHDDFAALAARQMWASWRAGLSLAFYMPKTFKAELFVVPFKKGIFALKGDAFELYVEGFQSLENNSVPKHYGFGAGAQWLGRIMPTGDVHVGPKIGYQNRIYFNRTGVDPYPRGHFLNAGLLLRYMSSRLTSLFLNPQIFVNQAGVSFETGIGFSLML